MAARERSGQRPRRRWVLTIACLIAVALALGAAALSGFSSDPEVLPRPNVVLFMTDDQPASTVMPETMPSLHELIIGPGTSFTDFIATTPLCCPSRAALMTGQYGHNNGVLNNNYANLIDKENVLPAWLQQAGYNTALIGKFLNGYERFAETPEQVGPGWDRWFVQLPRRSYYNWTASKDGRLVSFGGADSDHATEVTSSLAARWTGRLSAKSEPFFLQVNYYAPHYGFGREAVNCAYSAVTSPEDAGAFNGFPLPSPPSFNEADVSDKPPAVRKRPLLGAREIKKLARRYRCTLASLLGVDRGIRAVYEAIAASGELDRTVFIFTVDNGYFFGQHRLPIGRASPTRRISGCRSRSSCPTPTARAARRSGNSLLQPRTSTSRRRSSNSPAARRVRVRAAAA